MREKRTDEKRKEQRKGEEKIEKKRVEKKVYKRRETIKITTPGSGKKKKNNFCALPQFCCLNTFISYR